MKYHTILDHTVLGSKEIKQIAELAKLSIPKENRQKLINDLDGILALIIEMHEVDINQIEPLAHPLEQTQRLREDEVTETNQREVFQQIAPQTSAGLYIVPKVIDNE